MTELPAGFRSYVANAQIKDDTDDLAIIVADDVAAAAGMFTKSRFEGPSVTVSRDHLADGRARVVAVVAKNANVANGAGGLADTRETVAAIASQVGCSAEQVLIASTGVIGRRYPMATLRAAIAAMPVPAPMSTADGAARAIMTTDTVPKIVEAQVAGSDARVVGIAKGVGMIEPDMATMIAVLLTDAEVAASELDAALREVVDGTFNCVSIDTDTSTSDTVFALASGAAGPVTSDEFRAALCEVALALTKAIAADGEGAETLIEVRVDRARDAAQAKRVAKAIVNSPLVKTAVKGADPNWGRVAMAIGKCSDDTDIDQERVVIRFGDQEVYPTRLPEPELEALSSYLAGDEVLINVSLGTGHAQATVWGCDLTEGYVHINADYTT